MSDDQRQHTSTEAAGPPLPLFGAEEENIPGRIGKFRILDLISRSMALVYKAEQDNPRRTVALKIPRGGQLLSRPARERFLREVNLAARLNHPGIVPVLEAGEIDGTPYYTMPFVEGRSLAQFVEMDAPGLPARLDAFLRLCDILQALHAEGLVHRDLKPENVMLDKYGNVRLLDFGLAKACDAEAPQVTVEHTLHGTLQCMAPEQTVADPQPAVGPPADVYALGMLLHLLLTGRYPYSTKGPRDAALQTIRESRPRPPSAIAPELGARYDAVVLAALEKEASRRPPTAGELARRLKAAIGGRPADSPPAAPALGASGRRMAWALISAGALAVLAGVVLVASRGGASDRMAEARPTRAANDDVRTVAAPSSAERFSASQLAVMAGGESADNAAVPPELWAVYQQASKALREDFAHRGDGAVLLQVGRRPPSGSTGTLTWRAKSGDEQTCSDSAGDAIVVYIPASQEYEFEVVMDGNVSRRTVSATVGAVTLAGI